METRGDEKGRVNGQTTDDRIVIHSGSSLRHRYVVAGRVVRSHKIRLDYRDSINRADGTSDIILPSHHSVTMSLVTRGCVLGRISVLLNLL